MNKNLLQNRYSSPIVLRTGLLIVLLASLTGVFGSVAWVYHRVNQSLGLEIAEVVVAVLVIVVFGLITVGFRTANGARQDLREHKCRARRIYCLFKRCTIFKALWGHVGLPSETLPKIPAIQVPARMDIVLDTSPKRGRPATYSIDHWIPVVSAWENRDRWRNTLTLAEFLAEKFGTNADGSPVMSVNSYYDWKKRVLAELQKRKAEQRDISLN
jgi:hypothetical protein